MTSYLIVDGLGGGLHDDVSPLGVDLGVEFEGGIPDEVDHPVFSLLLRHIQLQCQLVDRDALRRIKII